MLFAYLAVTVVGGLANQDLACRIRGRRVGLRILAASLSSARRGSTVRSTLMRSLVHVLGVVSCWPS